MAHNQVRLKYIDLHFFKTCPNKGSENLLRYLDHSQNKVRDLRTPRHFSWLVSTWDQLIRLRRWAFVLLGLILLSLQINEIKRFPQNLTLIHLVEIFLSLFLVVLLGIFVEVLIRKIEHEAHVVKILDLKHRLSLQLAAMQEWKELTDLILQFLSSIVNSEHTCLVTHNSDNLILEKACERNNGLCSLNISSLSNHLDLCQACALSRPNSIHSTQACKPGSRVAFGESKHNYCMPLSFGEEFVGLIYFNLSPGDSLSSDKIDILNSVGNEISIALSNARQHKKLLEIKLAEAAFAERAIVSRDLHDTLGQDLSYLHLKLEQLLADGSSQEILCAKSDLEKMHAAVNEANELVRATLKSLRSIKSPLTSLIQDQARMVASHENIGFKFTEEGRPQSLSPDVLCQLYFVYREAMSNITKHSCAQNFEASVVWRRGHVTIKIRDDGTGFDPEAVATNQHFGLSIMRERVEALKGRFELKTKLGAGTEVTIWLPLA